MSYAPFLAAAFVLWPVMGLLGGQGYAPLLVLAALAALGVARPKGPPAFYFVICGLFLAWTMISESWSPASDRLVSGNIFSGNFAIEAASARIIATFLFGTLVVAGALRLQGDADPRSARVMFFAFIAQFICLLVSALFSDPLLRMVYGDDEMRQYEGVQNIMRNANAFVLALPLLTAWLATRDAPVWRLTAFAIVAMSAILFVLVDNQAALMALMAMGLSAGFVMLVPKTGLRWLMGALGAYVAATPIILGFLTRALRAAEIPLPGSFQSRVFAWQVTIERTAETPMTGHGLNATRTWREPFRTRTEWMEGLPPNWADYPIVPGHPHNMALQVWAETGFIGAVLCGLAIMAIAFRMPRAEDLSVPVRYATAAMIGAVSSLMSFTYSAWNEAFWASAILAVAGLILFERSGRASV
jgi:O-antigen ligase